MNIREIWSKYWLSIGSVIIFVAYLFVGNAVIALLKLFWPKGADWVNANPLSMFLFASLCLVIVFLLEKVRRESREKKKLIEDSRPKLRLLCGKDIPGCRIFGVVIKRDRKFRPHLREYTTGYSGYNTSHVMGEKEVSYHALFLRVAVYSECNKQISGCHAKITRIDGGEDNTSREISLPVPFSPAHDDDAFAKRIPGKETEYIDIFTILTQNSKFVSLEHDKTYLFSNNLSQIFNNTGEYHLRLIVSGQEIITHEALLKFNWTGNWETTDLSCIEKNT